MKSRIILFAISFVAWILLGGHFELQHALVGVLVAAIVAIIAGDMFIDTPSLRPFLEIRRYLWFLYFLGVFVGECFKANIDMALRVLHPQLPLKPGIVKVKTSLKSSFAQAFLANSITLAPRTFCVDIDAQDGFLYVHWIDVKSAQSEEATRLIVSKFENILKRVFE